MELMKHVTIWNCEIAVSTDNNLPYMMEVCSEKKPTFKQIKRIWEFRNHNVILGKKKHDQYYYLRSVKPRKVICI